MFSARSRYLGVVVDPVELDDGRSVVAVRFPMRHRPEVEGYHRRLQDQRLDHIAAHYLKDPTAFWRLCDANETISPGALAAREVVGVPRKES